MVEFARAAFPWICVGISVAVACAIIARRSKKK